MPSEYDPLRRSADDPLAEDSLERVHELFADAGRPYLSRPWSWLAWSLILPAAALATPTVLEHSGELGVLVLWSLAVLTGGATEIWQILGQRQQRRVEASSLAAWVLRAQGNLSLVALVVSLALLLRGEAWLLPGLWLLLLGHSLYSLGGLAAPSLRSAGLIYQAGGLLAVWPHGQGLVVFALATGLANLWIAWSIWRAASASR